MKAGTDVSFGRSRRVLAWPRWTMVPFLLTVLVFPRHTQESAETHAESFSATAGIRTRPRGIVAAPLEFTCATFERHTPMTFVRHAEDTRLTRPGGLWSVCLWS